MEKETGRDKNTIEKKAELFDRLWKRRNPDDPDEVYKLRLSAEETEKRKRLYALCCYGTCVLWLFMATRFWTANVTKACGMLHGLEALVLLWLALSTASFLSMKESIPSYWYRVGIQRIVPLTFFGMLFFFLNAAVCIAALARRTDTAAHCLILFVLAAAGGFALSVIFRTEKKAFYVKDYIERDDVKNE